MQEALVARSASVASGEIRDAKALAFSRYEKYVPQLLSESVAEFMARIDASQASIAYAEFRNQGHDNDPMSFARGMRVFVTTSVKNSWARTEGAETFTPRPNGLWQRDYPHGIFRDGLRGNDPEDVWLTIYSFVEPGYKGGQGYSFSRREDESAFCVPHKSIVRIEGGMGELWQNPKLGTNGSLKMDETVPAKA